MKLSDEDNKETSLHLSRVFMNVASLPKGRAALRMIPDVKSKFLQLLNCRHEDSLVANLFHVLRHLSVNAEELRRYRIIPKTIRLVSAELQRGEDPLLVSPLSSFAAVDPVLFVRCDGLFSIFPLLSHDNKRV